MHYSQRVNERQIREDIVGWAISGTLGSVLGAGDGFGKNSLDGRLGVSVLLSRQTSRHVIALHLGKATPYLFSGGSSDKKLGRSVALSVIAV